MNKEEILSKVTESVRYIFDETESSVISDYSISPFFDLQTGEESGIFVTFVCGSEFQLSEALLNYWKEQLGANDFMFKYYSSQLYLTFFVDYDKVEEKESEPDRIKTEIKKAISAAIAYSLLDQETADKCFAWVDNYD